MNVHVLKIFSITLGILCNLIRLTAMPIATPATQSAMPTSMPTAQQSPQTVPAPAPATSTDKARLKEVEAALRELEQTKQTLTALLTELDAKLLEARKQAAEAESLKFSLLDKKDEQSAKADFAKVRAASDSVKETQNYVQTVFTKNFNDKISDLRVKATQADAALKMLNTKPAATASAMPSAGASTAMPTATTSTPEMPTSTPAKETEQKAMAKKESKGFLDNITSGIASIVKGITGFFGSNDAGKKKTVTTPQPEPIPADPAQRAQQATLMLQQMGQQIQSLDATRGTIHQYIESINQSSQYIESLAKQTPEGTKLLADSKKPIVIKKDPKWKSAILTGISKILDGIGQLGSNLYELFDGTIGSFSRNLVKDVKKKISSGD